LPCKYYFPIILLLLQQLVLYNSSLKNDYHCYQQQGGQSVTAKIRSQGIAYQEAPITQVKL
ncbi:MAG TPA: hypothetical protein PK233_07205, partial [Candidatus Atribacteria bacterium]|nr:hypothetical protein [Candidatus Atribacteria bacterium]